MKEQTAETLLTTALTVFVVIFVFLVVRECSLLMGWIMHP
jgi:hypothetical protein